MLQISRQIAAEMAVQYRAGASTLYQTLMTEKAAESIRYMDRDIFWKKVLASREKSEKVPQIKRAIKIWVAW